jgi:hypothetical protein
VQKPEENNIPVALLEPGERAVAGMKVLQTNEGFI